MSAAAVTLPNEASAYDFTTAQAQAFGTSPLADLGSGVFGLFAGEANNSGLVSAADISLAIGALNATGYQITDANMSGLVTAADISVMISSLNKASQLP
jgi:hypothetical protein